MAERNQPGADPGDVQPEDEVLDDDDAVVDDDDADEPVSRGGGTATRERVKAEPAEDRPKARKETEGVGFFGRIVHFFREVVAELRKVIWPTRKELLTYSAVVIVFLAVMTAVVVGFDVVFARLLLWALGK